MCFMSRNLFGYFYVTKSPSHSLAGVWMVLFIYFFLMFEELVPRLVLSSIRGYHGSILLKGQITAVRVNLGPALKEENNQEGEGKIHGMKIVATSGIQYLGAPVSMI